MKTRSDKGKVKEKYKSYASNTKNPKISLEEMERIMEEMSFELSKLILEK
jgi:hypothetical protein